MSDDDDDDEEEDLSSLSPCCCYAHVMSVLCTFSVFFVLFPPCLDQRRGGFVVLFAPET